MKPSRTLFLGIGAVVIVVVIFVMYAYVNLSSQTSTGSMSGMAVNDMQKVEYSGMGGPTRDAGLALGMVGEAQMDAAPSAPTALSERKEIKSGSLSLVVEDVPVAVEKITAFTQTQEGYVVSTYLSKESRFPSASVTVRVPAAQFDASMSELKKLGDVRQVQVQGQDVTEEYVDLEAQLKNLRVTEAQFAEIMKKAQKIEDILAVQAELSRVRGEIEGLEGRKKYLDQNVSYSIISVNLSSSAENLPIVDEGEQWKPKSIFKMAVHDLWAVGKGFANIIIWLVVFAPVWGIIIALVYYAKKKWMK